VPEVFFVRKKALGKATPFVRIEGAPVATGRGHAARVLLRWGVRMGAERDGRG